MVFLLRFLQTEVVQMYQMVHSVLVKKGWREGFATLVSLCFGTWMEIIPSVAQVTLIWISFYEVNFWFSYNLSFIPSHSFISYIYLDCECSRDGTIGRLGVCDVLDGQCACKPFVGTPPPGEEARVCSQCKNGYYGLEVRNSSLKKARCRFNDTSIANAMIHWC